MPAGLQTSHAACAIFGVVYVGVPVAQEVYFPDNAASACLNAVPAGLAQPGIDADVSGFFPVRLVAFKYHRVLAFLLSF